MTQLYENCNLSCILESEIHFLDLTPTTKWLHNPALKYCVTLNWKTWNSLSTARTVLMKQVVLVTCAMSRFWIIFYFQSIHCLKKAILQNYWTLHPQADFMDLAFKNLLFPAILKEKSRLSSRAAKPFTRIQLLLRRGTRIQSIQLIQDYPLLFGVLLVTVIDHPLSRQSIKAWSNSWRPHRQCVV